MFFHEKTPQKRIFSRNKTRFLMKNGKENMFVHEQTHKKQFFIKKLKIHMLFHEQNTAKIV